MSTNFDSNRLPPQNLEAEEAVLGGILLDKEAIVKVVDILRADDFYRPDHGIIYDACRDLFEKNQPIDLVTLTNLLEEKKKLEGVGGASYLSTLVANTASAANIIHHANIVQGKSVLRRLISTANNISAEAFEEGRDAMELLDDAEKKLFDVAERRLGTHFIPIKDVLGDSFERIDELHRNKGQTRGVPCGFKQLDNILAGFQKSDLLILAARPSMGKTALALNIAAHAAIKEKIPVGIFSLEMSKEQLVDRLLTMEAMIDSWKLRTGNLDEDDFSKLNYAMGELSEAPLFIDDTPLLSAIEIKAKARRLQVEHGLGMVVVDYLQLMEGSRRGNEMNRVQEVSDISRALKALARELKVPVLALSQLSRAVESRPGAKIPQLSDLRESGCLTADTMIYLPQKGFYVSIRDLIGSKRFAVGSVNNVYKIENDTVVNAFSTGTKQIFKITTALGKTIKATANHKFLTISGWKRLDQLKKGEHLAQPRSLVCLQSASMTKDEVALLGHLIGDGCTLPCHSIQYTTNSEILAKTVLSLSSKIFGGKIKPRIKKERTWYQVYLTASEKLSRKKHNPIADWMNDLIIFGLRSYEKRIPHKIFAQPQELIAIFLRHLWSTDGCIRMRLGKKPYPAIYYATSSIGLAGDVQSILLKIGIISRLKHVSQGAKGKTQYHIVITGKSNICGFIKKIGTVGDYRKKQIKDIEKYLSKACENTNNDVIPKDVWRSIVVPALAKQKITSREFQKKLGMKYCGSALYKSGLSRLRAKKVAQIIKSQELMNLAESDIFWDKIVQITKLGNEEVYDLTTQKNHNFIANNIVVHNSIEQDADVVMFIYREEYYEPDTENKGIAKILIRKHRNGPVGDVDLYFHPEYSRFTNIEKSQQPQEG